MNSNNWKEKYEIEAQDLKTIMENYEHKLDFLAGKIAKINQSFLELNKIIGDLAIQIHEANSFFENQAYLKQAIVEMDEIDACEEPVIIGDGENDLE